MYVGRYFIALKTSLTAYWGAGIATTPFTISNVSLVTVMATALTTSLSKAAKQITQIFKYGWIIIKVTLWMQIVSLWTCQPLAHNVHYYKQIAIPVMCYGLNWEPSWKQSGYMTLTAYPRPRLMVNRLLGVALGLSAKIQIRTAPSCGSASRIHTSSVKLLMWFMVVDSSICLNVQVQVYSLPSDSEAFDKSRGLALGVAIVNWTGGEHLGRFGWLSHILLMISV